jgi:Alginate export
MRHAGHAVLVALVVLFTPCFAHAQDDPQPAAAPSSTSQPSTTVRAYVRDTARVESWSFFEPRPGGGDPTYTFLGNRSTLGVRVNNRRLDVDGAFQYAQLIRLPARSIVPGALGTGALYFFSAQATEAYQLYFKTMMVRWKDVVPGVSMTMGRMGYSSGEENVSGNASIETLKRLRLGSRLIGEFEWSIVQRSFDGARLDIDRPLWSASGALLFPTQGGYEESANPTISAIKVLAATFTAKPAMIPHQEAQLFVYHYRDLRDVRVRPDNAGPPVVRVADISIGTVGASHAGVFPTAAGQLDTVFWVAGQIGDWYGQKHRALSAAAEAGLHLSSRWRPWLRAGFLHASGDRDANDNRHGTFFQMLPTVRRYSLSTAYAQMNLRDLFAQVSVTPRPSVTARLELHRLSLATAADRWYSGSGATNRHGTYFGFSGRASSGARTLGTMTEGSVDVVLDEHWSVNGYAGWMQGGDVVKRLFAGKRLLFFYVENVLSF